MFFRKESQHKPSFATGILRLGFAWPRCLEKNPKSIPTTFNGEFNGDEFDGFKVMNLMGLMVMNLMGFQS